MYLIFSIMQNFSKTLDPIGSLEMVLFYRQTVKR